VQVGAADPGLFDFDQAIADSELGKGNVLEFESQAAVVFDKSFHGRIRYLVMTARRGECARNGDLNPVAWYKWSKNPL
jgi:hypothetical protein